MIKESKKKILIADDEEALLFALKKTLQTHQVEVDTVSTMKEAKQMLNENRYDAVISDLRLDGSALPDGMAIISEAGRVQPKAKIIIMTGYGSRTMKEKIYGIGADAYLEKPVSPYEIKEILEEMDIY